ncbi:hypothetical protein [Cupriavidus pauculus]|uniref:Uncharacterized protein n=1 Tax=Cupriavidus pauculus TaxID=82633 RepID=A0A3G8H5P9_9BURK|nr:hypothetical protein [Cupriavidus pauculus]AZG14862.1 hypothetical protein EHF44_16320 [Cupriavidus pauculus]
MSHININEYELRQLALMCDFLIDYTDHRISLNRLLDVLEGLLLCVPNLPSNWRTEFHEHWFSLEQARAIALDRGEDVSVFAAEIEAAIAALKDLVAKQLDVPAK